MEECWHILKVVDKFSWSAATELMRTELVSNKAKEKKLKKIAKPFEDKRKALGQEEAGQ